MIEIIPAIFGTPTYEACLAIRVDVFVNEQNISPEEELDAFEQSAIYVLALVDGKPAGTARAVKKASGDWKISRVAVRATYRQQGIGVALMQSIEAACPTRHFTLSAQTHALNFYKKLGYLAEGPEFLEAGIPHYLMHKDV